MNRNRFLSSTMIGGLALASGFAKSPTPGLEPSLRKLSKLALGVSMKSPIDKVYTPAEQELIRRHFDIITPENAMKWDVVRRKEDQPYRLERADELLQFAEAANQRFLGHTLLFNRDNEYPDWIFGDDEDPASRAMVERRLREHIFWMMQGYSDRIYAWDVVNEAVEEKVPYYRETNWYRMFGPDFVPLAFHLAREADPKALLIYNDYRVEIPRKRERVLLLLEELKKQGAMPDVVGIQGHWELGSTPFENLEETIIELNQVGVSVSVTELDIDVISRQKYWNQKTRPEAIKQDPYRDGCPADILKQQAEEYGQLFEIFMRHPEKMERITFWGLTDRHSWLNKWPWERVNHGLLFDRNAQPKPAFHAVAEAIRNG
ncbi:MAG: endo-1,4-beta-xylanase [Kiritimatiellales bacterium]|nr:endo-1,4-beta-xylanase [Kiritimatiellales bacterium]